MKSHALDIVDVLPVESEFLTAREFLDLVKNNPGLIKESKAVSGRFGSGFLGGFKVAYTRPIYKAGQKLTK